MERNRRIETILFTESEGEAVIINLFLCFLLPSAVYVSLTISLFLALALSLFLSSFPLSLSLCISASLSLSHSATLSLCLSLLLLLSPQFYHCILIHALTYNRSLYLSFSFSVSLFFSLSLQLSMSHPFFSVAQFILICASVQMGENVWILRYTFNCLCVCV